MIIEPVFTHPDHHGVPQARDEHPEISRLLAAAVVSPSFCQVLLEDPQQAIEAGYQGEKFSFSDLERYLLLFVHAENLADLASQLIQALSRGLQIPAPVKVCEPVLVG
jgi:hypothetical protein